MESTSIMTKKHHNALPEDQKRKRIGPFVSPSCFKDIRKWAHEMGSPYGHVIDGLTGHGKATGFDPKDVKEEDER